MSHPLLVSWASAPFIPRLTNIAAQCTILSSAWLLIGDAANRSGRSSRRHCQTVFRMKRMMLPLFTSVAISGCRRIFMIVVLKPASRAAAARGLADLVQVAPWCRLTAPPMRPPQGAFGGVGIDLVWCLTRLSWPVPWAPLDGRLFFSITALGALASAILVLTMTFPRCRHTTLAMRAPFAAVTRVRTDRAWLTCQGVSRGGRRETVSGLSADVRRILVMLIPLPPSPSMQTVSVLYCAVCGSSFGPTSRLAAACGLADLVAVVPWCRYAVSPMHLPRGVVGGFGLDLVWRPTILRRPVPWAPWLRPSPPFSNVLLLPASPLLGLDATAR